MGTWQYGYEADTGQLISIDAPGGVSLGFGWDGFLPVSTTWTGPVSGTVERDFDENFFVTQRSVNGNAIAFSYDDDGLLTAAGDLTLTRSPEVGLVTGSALGSVSGSRAYNEFGELAARDVDNGGSTDYEVSYTRDDLGRIIEETETVDGESHTFTYSYDESGRLIEVSRDGSTRHTYSYDDNGNRLQHVGPDGTETGSYDAQDRLTAYDGADYSYTKAGELQSKTTSAGTTTYDYDAFGNLREVGLPDGRTIEYVIDGRNRRVGKKIDGQLVQGFVYKDQLNPIAELDGSGNVEARFVYGGKLNVPAFVLKNGKAYRIISDHLGSVRLVIDTSTGDIVQRMDYSPFGRVITDTNPGFQPFGFAGGIHDADTGLVRFGARDYDPVIGRWTSKDPILFAGGSTNLFGYVLNDPVNLIDRTGRLPSLPRPVVNVVTGFGDGAFSAITLGIGDLQDIRDFANIDGGVNQCSELFEAGSLVGQGVGAFALGGAVGSKLISSAKSQGPLARTALFVLRLRTGNIGPRPPSQPQSRPTPRGQPRNAPGAGRNSPGQSN